MHYGGARTQHEGQRAFEIDRDVHRSEFERALDRADELGLRRFDNRSRAALDRPAAA